MQIFWTSAAQSDLEKIESFIALDNPVASVDVVLESIDQVERLLPHNPALGRAGRVHETREMVIVDYPNYVVIYRVRLDILEIVRVLHAARKWPE